MGVKPNWRTQLRSGRFGSGSDRPSSHRRGPRRWYSLCGRGLDCRASGPHTAAIEHAEKALQLHPNSAYVEYNAGFALLGSAKIERARRCFERSLELNPIDARRYFAFQGIGISYFFERKFEEALPWLQGANDEAPSNRNCWRFRAAAFAHWVVTMRLAKLSPLSIGFCQFSRLPNCSKTYVSGDMRG